MRGLVAICLGFVVVLGAGAVSAGIGLGECGVCECKDDGRRLCMQDTAVDRRECEEFCGSTNVIDFSAGFIQCTEVAGCPQSARRSPAPAASPYGIAALLIALGGFGAWRLRKRVAAA